VFDLAFVFASDGDGEVRNPVNKIGCAIEWIDNPFVIGIFAGLVAAFFTADAVIRVGFAQMVDDFFFSRFIYFGNEVVATFGLDG